MRQASAFLQSVAGVVPAALRPWLAAPAEAFCHWRAKRCAARSRRWHARAAALIGWRGGGPDFTGENHVDG
ncbi:MAG: hypothetical protein AB7L41_04550 [Flavobacteriaceae bacterium]